MKRLAIAILALLPACGGADKPYATNVGALAPGATMTVKVRQADVSVYKPQLGDPGDRFTVSATALGGGTPPPAPSSRPAGNGVVVLANTPLRSLLVRAPEKVNVVVDAAAGNVSVTDISGTPDVRTGSGNVSVMVSGYARAHADRGNVNVTMGALDWPGTVAISSGKGDVVVYVNENAHFRVRMHTGDGVLFTDFAGLHGISQGRSESIEADVNGGGPRVLDLESGAGEVRLLRLTPQA